jgi:hypothetical protein
LLRRRGGDDLVAPHMVASSDLLLTVVERVAEVLVAAVARGRLGAVASSRS